MRRIGPCRKEVPTTATYLIGQYLHFHHLYRRWLVSIYPVQRNFPSWPTCPMRVLPSMVAIISQWILIDGSWSYPQKNINAVSRMPLQQSSSSVELHSAGFIQPSIKDQVLIAGHSLPKSTTSFGLMQGAKTHSLHGLTKTKLLSPVSIHFKPVKAMYTAQLQFSSAV